MNQKVVIIGHSYTSRLGIIRSLGPYGFELHVVVLAPYNRRSKTILKEKPIDCYSKFVSKYYICERDEHALLTLLETQVRDNNQKIVLLPDSDFSAAIVDKNLERLSQFFICPNIKGLQGGLIEWMDKNKQKELASSLGLAIADSTIIHITRGKGKIPNNIQYPVFTKPLCSIEGGKIGLCKCDNNQDLEKVIKQFATTTSTDVLVERYMPIENEYAVVGFSYGGKVYIPAVIEITSLAQGGHFGVAECGRVLPVGEYLSIIQKFKEFVHALGFVGLFDIDFYKSNGSFYFSEMNMRFGGSGYAVTKAGVNLPYFYINALIDGKNSEKETYIKHPSAYVNERMCVDDWYGSYISLRTYINRLNKSIIHFVKDKEDPKPFREFNKRFIKLFIKKIVKRIIK